MTYRAPKRPILRYHGGKWMIAPWIISHFPSHRIYVEPYCGAASVFLRKRKCYAEVINDMDDEIVNVWTMTRDRGQELADLLTFTPFARREFEDSYKPTDDPLERARRTIVRSFMGFGSDSIKGVHKTGFRVNANKNGTTPARDGSNYPRELMTIIARMHGVFIEHKPAIEVLLKHDTPKTLNYVDPPYVHSTRSRVNAGRGYHYEMSDDEHRELAGVLNTLKGGIVLSGYRCPLYDELFEGWHREECETHADGALDRTECLWLRNVPIVPRPRELFAHQ